MGTVVVALEEGGEPLSFYIRGSPRGTLVVILLPLPSVPPSVDMTSRTIIGTRRHVRAYDAVIRACVFFSQLRLARLMAAIAAARSDARHHWTVDCIRRGGPLSPFVNTRIVLSSVRGIARKVANYLPAS